MKLLTLSILIALCALALCAQESPSGIYAAGASWNPSAVPQVAGTVMMAYPVNQAGTYSFTVLDALPSSLTSAAGVTTVTTSIGQGIAQRVVTIGKVQMFASATAGFSYNGLNSGWAWTGGVLASVPLRDQWKIMPTLRFVKSSVSNGTGYQLVTGVMFGWGR